MIWGKTGDYYQVEYTVGSGTQMWDFEFHTTKHHNVEQQAAAAIGRHLGVPADQIKIYHAIRCVK